MTEKAQENRQPPDSWSIPRTEETQISIQYFWARTKGRLVDESVIRNITFKLHHLSKRKVWLLLEVFVFITNIIAQILEQWREDPRQPRDDGAGAALFRVQDKGVFGHFRTRALSGIIGHQFDPSIKSQNTHHIARRLVEGAYRDCARMIVRWGEGIASRLLRGKPKDYILNVEEFYAGWVRLVLEYQQAAEIVVSLGYDPDHPPRRKDEKLIRESKREARQVLERLCPLEEINRAIVDVEALLSDEPSALKRAAVTEEHLWMVDLRHQRAVRESRLMRRLMDSNGNHRVLGELLRSDLEIFRDELYEMRAYIERAQYWIAHAEQDSDDVPAQTATNELANKEGTSPGPVAAEEDDLHQYRKLRDVLETFLYDKPTGYPHVARISVTGKALVDRIFNEEPDLSKQKPGSDNPETPQEHYERRLGAFQHKARCKDDAKRFTSAKKEAKEVQGMFQALRAMKPPVFQPLFFIGTTRPINYRVDKRISGQYRDGALLYEKTTVNGKDRYRFVFAAILYEKKSASGVAAEKYMQQTGRGKQFEWYQERRERTPLWYVNFPNTPFYLPEGTSVIYFPLEYGSRYHEQQLVMIIEQQREAQQQAYEKVNRARAKPVPIAKCLPEHTPVTSARMICSWNERSKPEFYLHVTVATPSTLQAVPTRVISFSPHEDTFAYAVMAFDGTVEMIGDIVIPKDLRPKRGKKKYSDNYIYWMSNAMLAKAWAWEAYIVVEDISWMRQRASTSRTTNREIFSLPFKRIMTTLRHKARQEGWMEPRLVDDVSPAYDCACCQHRLTKGSKTLTNEWVSKCPRKECGVLNVIDIVSDVQVCSACGHSWEPERSDIYLEQFFACPRCHADRRLAWYNRAIVTGQKGLIDLDEHRRNAVAWEQRNQETSRPAATSQK